MSKVTPIRPTVGMGKLDQLRAFVAFEQETSPDKTHIAAWALTEIARLREIEAAANNLMAQKGRHNTEAAYNRLVDVLKGEAG